ncbi:hypothetical protein CDL12_04829 [Handroanthus impetiginosus]|uniref:Pentacotripeptide-repeat region of PRORP domain-containing protein n=1 Tax=Handroanthus impetiginosus TaxID=429701 RepID=A0A2G9HYB5_9LAMI|nr:hypothetical protein CDL12_04829 [Handroanthus impetiginosus]
MISLRRLHKNSLTAERIYNATVRYFSIQSANPSPDATPSSSQYDELINAAGSKRDFAAVRDLLSERLIHGCFATNKTFNFIAKDVSVLDDLLQNLADLDDWFTRKHAHDALVAQLAKLCRTEEALRVAETMARKNYGTTIATFNSILTALARKKEISASWRVIELMRACKVRPSVASFNYIITSSCFRGDVRSTADALVKMEEEGLKADVRTYDALVLGACRAGKVDAALAMMRRMVEDGVPAIYSTYVHIIKEMVRCGYYAQAVEFVMIFAGRDEKLDAENFRYLIKRLKIRKRIEEAKLVVEEMVKRGLKIDDGLEDLSQNSKSEECDNI